MVLREEGQVLPNDRGLPGTVRPALVWMLMLDGQCKGMVLGTLERWGLPASPHVALYRVGIHGEYVPNVRTTAAVRQSWKTRYSS